MRMIVALVVVAMSLTLSGCACPPDQAGSPKPLRSKCALAQSQPRVPKFTKASAAKTLTKAARPVSKPSKPLTRAARPVSKSSKKYKTHLARPARPQIQPSASADVGSPLPPKKPDLGHVQSPASDAELPPPLPPRKPEETPTSAPDSPEHAADPDGKFKAVKEKAEREGVHALTGEDVRGLSQERLKELRGY
jgi:hypothetical protein